MHLTFVLANPSLDQDRKAKVHTREDDCAARQSLDQCVLVESCPDVSSIGNRIKKWWLPSRSLGCLPVRELALSQTRLRLWM